MVAVEDPTMYDVDHRRSYRTGPIPCPGEDNRSSERRTARRQRSPVQYTQFLLQKGLIALVAARTQEMIESIFII